MIFALLCLVAVSLCLLFDRAIRHQRLNGLLVRAIMARNDELAISLLQEGADGTACEHDIKPVKLSDMLARLRDRLTHRNRSPSDSGRNLHALLLYYTVRQYDGIGSIGTAVTYSEEVPLAILGTDCPIDEVDADGQSTLCLAANQHQHKVVRLLVDRGAKINRVPDREMFTPLMAADVADAEYLLDHGADVNLGTHGGNNALFGADSAKAELLLNRGANIEATNWQNETPLIYNCKYRQGDAVRTLLQHYSNRNSLASESTVALLFAVSGSSLETVQALLHAGADAGVVDLNGNSILTLSEEGNDPRVFEWLLGQPIDINAVSTSGTTALDEVNRMLTFWSTAGTPHPQLIWAKNKLMARGAKTGKEVMRVRYNWPPAHRIQ